MNDSFLYDHISNYDLFLVKDFGVFHLSVSDAAKMITKILALQGDLETELPEIAEDENYSLYDDSLDQVLRKDIQRHLAMIAAGIEKGTLPAARILRNPDESINLDETYLEIETLAKWLEERSISVYGDWYEQYMSDEQKVAENALRAIEIKRRIITKKEKDLEEINSEEKIILLKQQIEELHREKYKGWSYSFEQKTEKHNPKPLHTKEKETLLKMAVGMAIKGYTYNPAAKRNSATSEIKQDLELLGIQLDEDTIRRWLKEASKILPASEM